MIKAAEAKANVINYEVAIRTNIQNKVNELVDIMSQTIQFNSENGFDYAQFCPYEKSRFSDVKSLEYAQKLFQKIFEDAGYTILENHYGKNSLIVKW